MKSKKEKDKEKFLGLLNAWMTNLAEKSVKRAKLERFFIRPGHSDDDYKSVVIEFSMKSIRMLADIHDMIFTISGYDYFKYDFKEIPDDNTLIRKIVKNIRVYKEQ
jgi:hypothetical protein